MKRFFLLWLMLFAIEALVAGIMGAVVLRSFDARFEPLLTGLLAPAVGATLLLWLFPRLRDSGFVMSAAALDSRSMAATACLLLAAAAILSSLVVLRAAPAGAFDVARGVASAAGCLAFVVAGSRGIRGAYPAAAILLFLVLTTGRAERIAAHVLPSQPMGVRWLAFGAISATVVLIVFFRAVSSLRRSAPGTAAWLEWSLAPAMITALIVVSNFYFEPMLGPASSLAANVFGLAAVGLACLASIASLQRSA